MEIAISFYFFGVTIYTLPHFQCLRLISMHSSHHPFKMHEVGFRAFVSFVLT